MPDFSAYAHSELTRRIVASALQVHAELGPGLLESTYRACLAYQLSLDGMTCRQEVCIPIRYRGLNIDNSYRADLIVEEAVLLELKSVEKLVPLHSTQLLTYLRWSGIKVGLLMNFNVPKLKYGLRRFVR
jgi:GxxExxY protein